MATREKKLSTVRKQNTSSPLPKEDEPVTQETDETDTSTTGGSDSQISETKSTSPKTAASTARKIAVPRNVTTRKIAKKPTLTILKPKMKKTQAKIKTAAIKTLLKNTEKKKMLKKQQVQTKKKRVLKNQNKSDQEQPPVLELMVEEDEDSKTRKKTKRGGTVKADDSEEQPKAKRANKRKIERDPINETIDDVVNDLSALIKSEPNDTPEVIEEPKSEPKPKRIVKKKRISLGNLSLSRLSPRQRIVIDTLDLNINKRTGLATVKRRHSIEKFPVGNLDNQLVLNTLPSSIGPRSPRALPKNKTLITRRPNPYKTRSDSPARILRNGKHTKFKDFELLDGLGMTRKKRKRNYSDFSEGVSKCSEYESDSSFSDMSSLHGAETTENKEVAEVKQEKENDGSAENVIKRSLSIEGEANGLNVTDTNSNLCLNINDKANGGVKKEDDAENNIAVSPSVKVPEKSLILDIMKQTFNEALEENDKKKTEEEPEEREPTETVVEEDKQPEEEEEEVEVVPEVVPNGTTENGSEEEEKKIEESPENLAIKEHILQALGLQSMKAASEAKMRTKEKADVTKGDYTGTLKTVIKLNRGGDRKGKGKNMKMSVQKNKKDCDVNGIEEAAAKAIKDVPSTSWKQSGQSSDTAGAHRKSHYSNRSNLGNYWFWVFSTYFSLTY